MSRLKTLLTYVLWVVGFILISELLINVGLNSIYKKIERKDNISQVSVYQAEATKVNGRIKGIISNTSQVEDISGKYLKIDFYSKRNVFLGKKYIEIKNLKPEDTQMFEMYFKLKDIKLYEISIVNEKNSDGEIELLPKDLTKPEIILATIVTVLILW